MPKLDSGDGMLRPTPAHCLSGSIAHPRHLLVQAITDIVGSNIGLMVRAFAATLQDPNTLVQRNILELLQASLRLDGVASLE
jgi:hypothetical protein